MTILRSFLFNLYFFGLTFLLCLVGVWRRITLRGAARQAGALSLAQLWARLVLGGLRRICGIYPVFSGKEHLPPTGPALIASQHRSAYDTLIWLALLRRPSYVLKQELTRIPLFGALIRPAGMIALDRGGHASALRGLLRDTTAAVADQRQIVIFPEGTRAREGEQRPLLPGIAAMAARSRLPVIPVLTDSGQHWSRRAFRKRPGPVHIVILSPLPPGLPRDELMQRLTVSLHGTVSQYVDKSVGERAAGFG
jgi:1-acyl-sn-glycerol-3-phosphate acyltransferase